MWTHSTKASAFVSRDPAYRPEIEAVGLRLPAILKILQEDNDMTAYTVLRFTKLKSWGAVGGAGSHNARLRQTLNADPEALQKTAFWSVPPEMI